MTEKNETPMAGENTYHALGLIGELLSVGHFRIEHMPALSIALNYITAERQSYESSVTYREESQEAVAETVSNADGSQDTSDVQEAR